MPLHQDSIIDYETDTRLGLRFAHVVPLAFITYSLAFLDRNNFGYASVGMTKTLNLTNQMSALLPAVFFIGYFLFRFPRPTTPPNTASAG